MKKKKNNTAFRWGSIIRLKLQGIAEDVCRVIYGIGPGIKARAMHKSQGIDGILVTVGLCIIALLLCVVMKNQLATFIETIVARMTTAAENILSGV